MGTPLPAERDDFTEWKRWVEKNLSAVMARTASRPAFGVSDGGLIVDNNGAVRIIGSGGLTLTSGDAVDIFSATGWTGGYIEPDGEPQPMVILKRSDGSMAFFLGDPLPLVDGYQQFWAWYDRGGTIIFGDDTTSGKGLARPYLSFALSSDKDVVSLVSTATFAEAHNIAGYIQNPRMSVPLSVVAPATGPGEVRIVHAGTGTVVAGPTSIPAGTNVAPFYEFDVSGITNMFEHHYFSVQTRRVSGTGNITSRVFSAHGMQS